MKASRTLATTLAVGTVLVALLLLATGAGASAPHPEPPPGSAPDLPAAPAAITQYDSGWVEVAPGPGNCHIFTHNLGGDPDDYAVELWFRDSGTMGINRRGYGGLEDLNGSRQGAHWEKLTASSIDVCRWSDDTAADEVRVRVWIPADPPDYASPWTSITPGVTIIVPHNLGLEADNLSVSLWFQSATRGIHNLGYGGLAINATYEMGGAAWHHLTDTELQVTRFPQDVNAQKVRVVVTQADRPSWDSGWRSVSPGQNLFTHNLGVDPSELLVRGECRSTVHGTHQLFAGGSFHWLDGTWLEGAQGSHLQNLAANSVVLVRWPDDDVCPEARVRIWRRGTHNIFLPLVVRDP